MEYLAFEQRIVIGEDAYRVAFTSVGSGNLGLHVGVPHESLRHRYTLEDRLGLQRGSVVYLNQIHGTTVVFDADFPEVVEILPTPEGAELSLGSAPVADAAVSEDVSRGLGILVADCIPLVFVGKTSGNSAITAVAHAGRRGLLDGVIQRTLEAMVAAGAVAISAWIGPSICGKCYEVPLGMQAESEALTPGISGITSWGTPSLDLPAIALRILKSYPQIENVVTASNLCTFENSHLSSHRRGDASRIAGLVWKEGKTL